MSLRRSALAVLACGALVATVLVSPARVSRGRTTWTGGCTTTRPTRSRRAPTGCPRSNDVFGPVCGDKANDARSYWPSQDQDGAGYVYYHSYIGRDVGYNIRNHVEADHNNAAVRWLVGGYNCRYIAGTTSWSLHAWGAAIDTNSSLNPMGQDHWNGTGIDGQKYGTYLPDIWRGPYPGHKFFWGLNWDSKPDPMHFQYATGY